MRERKSILMLAVCLSLSLAAVAAEPEKAEEAGSDAKAVEADGLDTRMPATALSRKPLMRVFRDYEEATGLEIRPDWPSLRKAGVRKDTLVTLRARKMAFRKLLDLTLTIASPGKKPLSWYQDGEVVHVSTQAKVLARNSGRRRAAIGAADRPRRTRGGGVREINLDQTPLHLALGFLRDLAGVNFHVNWRALEATGISKETPITLKASGISVGKALDMVLDQLNVNRDTLGSVHWVIDEGVVHVSTGEALNRKTYVRTFDVGDLLMVVPNFEGPKISMENQDTGSGSSDSGNLLGGGTGGGLFGNDANDSGGGAEEESIAEQRKRRREELVQVIKESIGQEMWAPSGKGSIRLMGNKLVISQTPLGFKLLGQALANR
jgi:hypothetical protein